VAKAGRRNVVRRRVGQLRCRAPLTLGLLAAIALAGCSVAPPAPYPVPVAPAPTDELALYLDTLDSLVTGDRARQIDVFDEAERKYIATPTTASTLRYAVALVTAGHPGTDAQRGRNILVELLSTPDNLTPPERKLASIMLNHATVQLELKEEIRRLVATVDDRSRAQVSSERRVQALANENAQLRAELAAAQEKLNAVTDIERSIIERNSPRPNGAPQTRGPDNPETQAPTPDR
jgi:YfhG lipoprotein